jgi:hypothetical protein
MAFNINEFSGELGKGGVAKASHFEVFITGPSDKKKSDAGGGGFINKLKAKAISYVKDALFGGDGGGSRSLTARIDAADIPGRNLMTADYKHKNYGPIIKLPYGQVYSDVNLSIICSESLSEKKFFEEWQNQIVGTGYDYKGNGLEKFNLGYYDDYVGVVEIRQYGMSGQLQAVHKLNGAYPISIAPISMSWQSEDIVRLNVTMSFRNYRAEFQEGGGAGIGFGLSFGKNGLQARITSKLGNLTINKNGAQANVRTPFGILRKNF